MSECKLLDLQALADECGGCDSSDGGLKKSWIAESCDVADFIFDANGCVTAIIMVNPGEFYEYEYDDDDTSSYNQTSTRDNLKITFTQTAFFKMAGISKEKIQFVNGIKACCCLYAIHCFNSGNIMVQGIEYNSATGEWKDSKKCVKATPSVFSDTGAGEERIEITLISESSCASPLTTLTESDITAL